MYIEVNKNASTGKYEVTPEVIPVATITGDSTIPVFHNENSDPTQTYFSHWIVLKADKSFVQSVDELDQGKWWLAVSSGGSNRYAYCIGGEDDYPYIGDVSTDYNCTVTVSSGVVTLTDSNSSTIIDGEEMFLFNMPIGRIPVTGISS